MPRFVKSYPLMLRLATLLIVLSACFAAWAEDCRHTPPISLHSDEPFDLQVFFDQEPAVGTPLRIYDGGKLVHSAVTDRSGRVRLGLLPAGKYSVIIARKGTLELSVLPLKSGLSGDMISWFLFPKSRYKWVAGQRIAGIPCPVVMLKAD